MGREKGQERGEKKVQGCAVAISPVPSELEQIASVLENLHYETFKAGDILTAFKLIRQHVPELIVASLKLPSLDRYKLSQSTREEKTTQHIPFVFVTSPDDVLVRVMMFKGSMRDRVPRPVLVPRVERPEASSPVTKEEVPETPAKGTPVKSKVAEPVAGNSPSPSTVETARPKADFKPVVQKQELKTSPPPPAAPVEEECEEPGLQDLPETAEKTNQEDGKSRPPKLYTQGELFVLFSIQRAAQGEPVDLERGRLLVRQIIESISSEPALLLAATDRNQEFSVSTHSLNVAILALKMAQTLKCSPAQQANVGLAALLHEIGVVKVPKQLVHKPGKLNRQELELLRQKPVFAAQVLKTLHPEQQWLIEIAEQIYERENGKGFPRGLPGGQIREEAKILGVIDAFEARIHNRPHRKALTGYQSLCELTVEGSESFSDRMLKALIRCFSLYPYNEYIVLNTGETGRVVDIDEENSLRPVVQILYDHQGRKLPEPKVMDLTENPFLYIARAITAAELPPSH